MNNIRHDVANYHRASEADKNAFWLKEINKPYSTVSFHSRVKMNHTSRLVDAYLSASDDERAILWKLYDDFSQLYSDKDRYCERKRRQEALKEVS